MSFKFEIKKKDRKNRARLGIIKTPHGDIETPAYTPVATTATVKALDTQDIKNCNSQVVLANTYHLLLRPGLKVLEDFGGFGPFMKWEGPTITDSGGYQVSFFRRQENKIAESSEREGSGACVVKITDEGAMFKSYVDGSKQLITPERSMEIQSVLGADIIMAFDQPIGKDYSDKKIKEAFDRTLMWEERSFIHWVKLQKKRIKQGRTQQALYGIVQGGTDKGLRRKSLQFIQKTGFSGVAIGGESVGENPKVTAESLDTISDLWPDKPVHALGLGGGPEGIFEAVFRGVDTFDNTSVTRIARAGLLYVYPEDGGCRYNKFRENIKKSKFKAKNAPFSKICQCYACQNYSASYIHHLLVSRELTGFRLASIHNVHYINDLMARIRKSLKEGEFPSLMSEWMRLAQ